MSVNAEISGMNRITTEQQFQTYETQKRGEAPAEGSIDLRRRKYAIFAIETELLDELTEMMEEVAEDGDFDEDGQLEQYNDNETLDKLLRKLVYVERQPISYNVTVEFTVEALSQEEAEQKVQEDISWGADYHITSVYED